MNKSYLGNDLPRSFNPRFFNSFLAPVDIFLSVLVETNLNCLASNPLKSGRVNSRINCLSVFLTINNTQKQSLNNFRCVKEREGVKE